MLRFTHIVVLLPFLDGCATIVEGTNQNVLVNTNPAGADCGLYREGGLRIATIMNTPGSALVSKTKANIWIACVKPGYLQATYMNHSGVAGGTFGNIVLGGLVGWAIDSADGADNKYDGTVNITLAAAPAGVPATTAVLPATFEGVASAQPQAPTAPVAPSS